MLNGINCNTIDLILFLKYNYICFYFGEKVGMSKDDNLDLADNVLQLTIPESDNASINGLEDIFEIPSTNTVKAEYNFLRLPYFIPSKSHAKSEQRFIELIEKIKSPDGSTIEKRWTVTPSHRYDLPSLFEYKVFLALMQLVQNHKLKLGYIPKQINLPDLNKLCNMIGLDPNCWFRVRIKQAIKTMASNLCVSEDTFYDKANKKHINSLESFTLIKNCTFKGDKVDGEQIEEGHIVFNDIVHTNLEQNYVKSLDLDLIQNLKSEIAPVLYPHLSAIFNNFKPKQKYWEITYNWLAQRLGITVHQELKMMKKQLKEAHNELIESNYLEKVEWVSCKKIRYFFGEKAIKDKTNLTEQKTIFSQLNKKAHAKVKITSKSEIPVTKPKADMEAELAFLCMKLSQGFIPTQEQLKKGGIKSLAELKNIAIAKGFKFKDS